MRKMIRIHSFHALEAVCKTPYGPPNKYSAGSDPFLAIVGDFNNDNKEDLAVINYNHTSVLLGNGDGTFQHRITSVIVTYPKYLTAGDFNRDNKLDIVVVNSGSNVGILFGNGDGTFQKPIMYSTGLHSNFVV
jgi:hypothetical protein